MQERTTLVKTSAGAIHTLQLGTGRNLVFLHGWSADAATCRKLLRCLSTMYQVTIPTLPGWHPSYTLEKEMHPEFAFHTLGEWLDELNLHDVTVVGHSLGGVAAVHLATQRPAAITRLVLVDSVGVPIQRTDSEWHKLWLQKRLRMYRTYGVHVVTRLDRALLKHSLIRKHHLGRMSRYARTVNILSLLDEVKVPVEFLWGKQDAYTPIATARTMAEHCRASNITEVQGDHDWPIFTPEVLLDYLTHYAASKA